MTSIRFWVLSLILCVGFDASARLATNVCGEDYASGVKYNYCIYPSVDPNNKDIILHLHGVLGSEKTWVKGSQFVKLHNDWKKLSRPEPTVITISFGKV